MARPKKSAEMEVVFNNLKFATYDELVAVKSECEKMISKKKAEEIETLEKEIEEKKAKLATLKSK